MDYKNTADMLSLGLFMLLVGAVLMLTSDMIDISYVTADGLELRMYSAGLVLFDLAGVFLLVVLIRWAYRVATRHSESARRRMEEMERP